MKAQGMTSLRRLWGQPLARASGLPPVGGEIGHLGGGDQCGDQAPVALVVTGEERSWAGGSRTAAKNQTPMHCPVILSRLGVRHPGSRSTVQSISRRPLRQHDDIGGADLAGLGLRRLERNAVGGGPDTGQADDEAGEAIPKPTGCTWE